MLSVCTISFLFSLLFKLVPDIHIAWRDVWIGGLVTAVLFYVPYLGPIAAGIPPVLDAFVSCPSPWYVLGVVVFYLALVTLEGYVVVPVNEAPSGVICTGGTTSGVGSLVAYFRRR